MPDLLPFGTASPVLAPLRARSFRTSDREPRRFIVLPKHEIADTEAVVEDHGAFYVVEKTPPQARRLAEETDPRTRVICPAPGAAELVGRSSPCALRRHYCSLSGPAPSRR